jgi:hypothetical protein
MGSVLRRASGTFSAESDDERPPSPGSSIKSNPSKRKRRISFAPASAHRIFKSDGKPSPGPTPRNTSDSAVGTVDVDSPSQAGSPPVGEDSATADASAPSEAKDSQPHQTPVEGYITSSPILTTEQEEVMQFSMPQSHPTGDGQERTEGTAAQIGSETATPQAPTELEAEDTALSSSVVVVMTGSSFDSAPEPEPAKDEGDNGQKLMER